MNPRTDAMLNGALILAGLVASLDNIVVHWILGLHRLVQDSEFTLHYEIALAFFGLVLIAVGLIRERRARLKSAS
jgi:uncharacterized membrane protein